MKKMLYFIGYIFSQIRFFNFKMISFYNTYAVHNNGGYISGQVILANPKNIYIESGSSINGGQVRAGKNSKIIIGKNTIISYNVHIRANSHSHCKIDIPIKDQGEYDEDIIIGDDCWVGYGAQIMPGVKIGKGVIIGAGAVVTHNVNDYDVVVGVPARVVKNRKDEIDKEDKRK